MATPLLSSLRDFRRRAQLSQSELALRVGVSRHAILAIEAGRQIPSTLLALQLSQTLGCRVEDLFSIESKDKPAARCDAAVLTPGTRLLLGKVDDDWTAHPMAVGARAGDAVVVERWTSQEVMFEPLGELADVEDCTLVAGCAPLLGIASDRARSSRGREGASWVTANSSRALDLLERNLVHMAGVHLVDSDQPGGHEQLVKQRSFAEKMSVINLTTWRQGLVVQSGNPKGIRGVQDLLRSDLTFARREPDSGAMLLVKRLLKQKKLRERSLRGPLAQGHSEVARLVQLGLADVGVAIEPEAFLDGLEFIPLAEERFDLIVPYRRLNEARVARLIELVSGERFRREASVIVGYDMSATGNTQTIVPE